MPLLLQAEFEVQGLSGYCIQTQKRQQQLKTLTRQMPVLEAQLESVRLVYFRKQQGLPASAPNLADIPATGRREESSAVRVVSFYLYVLQASGDRFKPME